MRDALQHSLHLTFWAILVLSLGTVMMGLLVPPVAMRAPAAVPAIE